MNDNILTTNDIRVAHNKGEPIYEVKSGQTTIELSPRIVNIRKAFNNTLSANVWSINPSGAKRLVASKYNQKILINTINL